MTGSITINKGRSQQLERPTQKRNSFQKPLTPRRKKDHFIKRGKKKKKPYGRKVGHAQTEALTGVAPPVCEAMGTGGRKKCLQGG